MPRTIGLLTLSVLLLGLAGCSYLFYPRADDYATKAKGATGVETMINLTPWGDRITFPIAVRMVAARKPG